MISIHPYTKQNKKILEQFMNDLQDYLIDIDPMKRLRRLQDYGELYVTDLLTQVSEKNGEIFIAWDDDTPVGMIAGIVLEQSELDKQGYMPTQEARIIELIVREEYRGKHIGKMLMETIETHFKNNACDTIRVEVFAPNDATYTFYKKCGYQDRMIDMIKKL